MPQKSMYWHLIILMCFSFNLQIGAIILTPTRELAYQINEVVSHFLQYMPQFSSCLFIGGTTIQADVEKFVSKG